MSANLGLLPIRLIRLLPSRATLSALARQSTKVRRSLPTIRQVRLLRVTPLVLQQLGPPLTVKVAVVGRQLASMNVLPDSIALGSALKALV